MIIDLSFGLSLLALGYCGVAFLLAAYGLLSGVRTTKDREEKEKISRIFQKCHQTFLVSPDEFIFCVLIGKLAGLVARALDDNKDIHACWYLGLFLIILPLGFLEIYLRRLESRMDRV